MATGLFDLTGKCAIVTGGSRGIGKAIAHRLAEHGAMVIIASRDGASCAAASSEIDALVGRAATRVHPVDMENADDLAALSDYADREFGGADILVCNAAASFHNGPLAEIDDAAFLRTFQFNVLANNRLAAFAAPKMAERGGGSIIIVSSIGAMRANPMNGAYSISKAADLALVRALALELGEAKIRVNAILPGLVRTDLSRSLWEDAEAEAAYVAKLRIKRIGEPDDLAGIAVYLASPASQWTTGQSFIVDGGALS
ncbi:SDR family NAD(P)-dependent oxidoreductase [Sphingomonas colocasiae]|uniref:Glucose 1-dehydrogenase n=1 Tax=Sphingomonas colocasiae TaxID=1848973 RepID=A0ABS7PSI9_9SPHN|nr:glucose 1-dehydrogenase [Sphingomonas colocasiae]MBY8824307.1 glucose 1-dehydrogenase [Sphingomonas colocasiae]